MVEVPKEWFLIVEIKFGAGENNLWGPGPSHTEYYYRATTNGRLSTSTMRKYVYKWTRPCHVSGECPHDRVVSDCEAAQTAHEASKCPSSVSPHAIRHGYISSMLDAETPKPVLSERCDVSEAVIDKHYDERSENGKQNLRGRVLDRINQNGRAGYVE